MKPKNNRESRIIFICWLAYTAAYVGRLNFSASNVAIIEALGATKPDAGLVSSFFFFAYGAGQLVNGILSKRYNAKYMIFASLTVSAILNLLMPLCGDMSVMKYIWLVNGMAQSVLWSTLIKTLSDFVSDKKLPSAILAMSTTVAIGTLVSYGISALFVRFGIWQAVFYAASIVLIIAAFVWLFLFGPSEKKSPETEKIKTDKVKMSKTVGFALILAAIAGIANGFIKDGITTWVPSVLYEEFGLSQSFSILLTLFLPMVSTLGATIAKKTHEKISSHATMNMIFYAVSALLCAGILFSLKIRNLPAIMICFIGVACGMAMINNVITSMFALDYRQSLNAGFAAGLLNTFCYIGSTTTTYTLGAVSQTKGWNAVFVIMLTVCIAAAVICLAGLATERKHKNS
ncbi:MAG: MFS transporter [Clostridia bacterium]|nr:MFS transporter [Clostridia bacterium]